ncbi:MAG: hypothetical protein GYB64_15155 [Chloroflexi bacterium]|nr:hypothetical protein [Chloroflexota bacterium]
MRDGICPKCGSDEVYSGAQIPNKEGPEGVNTIPVWGQFATPAPLDNYVCLNCGYVESYLSDAHKLRQIATRWKRVLPFEEPYPAEEEPYDDTFTGE